MAKPTGTCAYCGANGELEESHILPKWTIRRAMKGSVTGKLREGDNVNKRVQDGEKVYLLCRDCEGKFSKLEGAASRAFDAGMIAHGAVYDKDFVLFLTSIIWRAGVVRADDLGTTYAQFAPALATALHVWKDVLEGNRSDFGGHPIWFILLDTDLAKVVDRFMKSESTDGRGAAPVLNRYLTNNFGAEIVAFETEGVALVWAKTTSWLILGVVAAPPDPAGTSVEVLLAGGVFPPTGHPVPTVALACLGYQSWQHLQEASSMLPEQREKLKGEWRRNAAKVAGSDQTRALQDDVALFGDAAFVDVPEAKE